MLKGTRLRAIARGLHPDDIVLELDDGRLCVVHLTWKVETDPIWPYCEFVAEIPTDDESS